MVKPALPYLDIIADAAQISPDHPLACYQVSGEFAMVHAGAAAGVYALRTMAFESVESMIRAGPCVASIPPRFMVINILLDNRSFIDPDLLYARFFRLVG
jgi:hypothetical protein